MLKRIKFIIFTLLCIIFLAVPCIAEDNDAADGGFYFDFNLALGVEAFPDKDIDHDTIPDMITYQKLTFAPDIGFGKFGLGFELTFHYEFKDNVLTVREQDWVPDDPTFMNVLELYLSKFRYIRYGFKGEPLFVKFGSIEDGTLGNGFIMGNYSNALFLPERRIFGLSLDIDGDLFGFPLIGMETFLGNVVDWNVLGARLYFRPLVYMNIPIISALQVGGSVIADINPDAYFEGTLASDAQVVFYDADVRLPILSSDMVSLAVFADAATYKFEKMGGMVGFGGNLIKFINYGAQLRMIGDGFVPNYFNGTYDLTKIADYENIERVTGASPGYIGWYGSIGTVFEGLFDLNFALDGPFGVVEAGNDQNPANYPHLRGVFNLAEKLIPGIPLSASAVYDKSLLRTFNDLISPESAFIQAKINYELPPAVITFLYQLAYSSATDEWEISSGLETSIKF